jgi:hypothetical protein
MLFTFIIAKEKQGLIKNCVDLSAMYGATCPTFIKMCVYNTILTLFSYSLLFLLLIVFYFSC